MSYDIHSSNIAKQNIVYVSRQAFVISIPGKCWHQIGKHNFFPNTWRSIVSINIAKTCLDNMYDILFCYTGYAYILFYILFYYI